MIKSRSDYLLMALFVVFLFGMAFTVFIPNITAAAALQQQVDGLPFILAWVLPILAIIAVVMFYSYRSICVSRTKGSAAQQNS